MPLLTRENLDDGGYRRGLALPSHLSWSDAQLAQSFADFWAQRPDGPVWVFAYGSLIWNPLLAFDEQKNATLAGWHRSFCLRSISGRGTPERPGRVLSLQPGGEVQGVALRVPMARIKSELRLLWAREMTIGAYLPQWVTLTLPEGHAADAITFVANTDHPHHEHDASAAVVAPLVAVASGVFGPNIDYVVALAKALRDRGQCDPYVDSIANAIKEHRRAG